MMLSSSGKRSLDFTTTSESDTSLRGGKAPRRTFPVPPSQWIFETPKGRGARSLPTPEYKNGQLVDTSAAHKCGPETQSTSSSSISERALESSKKKMEIYMRNLLAELPSSPDEKR